MRRHFAVLPPLAAAAVALALAAPAPAVVAPPQQLTGDFTLTATASASNVAVGGSIIVNVALVSTGSADLVTPTLTASYQGQVAELSSATASNGGCTPDLRCTLATVTPGQRVDATLTFKALAPGTLSVSLNAGARWSRFAELPSALSTKAQTAAVTVAVTQRVADLAVTLAAPSGKTKVGKIAKVVATIANRGANDAPGATLDLTVPRGTRLVAISAASGACLVSSRRCTFAMLAASSTARVVLSLLASRPGAAAVVARAKAGEANDPSSANDIARIVFKPVPASPKP